MPEYSEVRLTSEYINAVNENKIIVDVEFLSSNKLKLVEELNVIGSHLSSKSRGKELKLYFDYDSVVITLGMSGGFKLFNHPDETNLKWKHGHIRFKLNDGSYFVWHDVRRFGKSLGGDWTYSKRGPDMFDETEKFISNIFENKDHRDFKKPAYEVLMNQKWFNGVGNYLRAEILGKWGETPFQPMVNLLNEKFLKHLIAQVSDSYRLGGGQLYTWKNESYSLIDNSWDEWMQFYGTGSFITDSQGRRFWFDKKFEK